MGANVAPRGLRGRVNGAWLAASNVYGNVAGDWRPARFVYAYDATTGVWNVVWASGPTCAVNPLAVLESDGSVTITWDAPDPEVAVQYVVRNSAGATIADGIAPSGRAVYGVVDDAPLVGVHAYTIVAQFDGQECSVETNTVTVGELTGSLTATVTNEGVDSDVELVWTEAVGAQSYNVYDIAGNQVGSATTGVFTDTNPKAGVGSYSVRAVALGGDEGPALVSNSLTLAQAPSSLSASSSGQTVTLTWDTASCGSHDQVQVLRNGSVLATLARATVTYADAAAPAGTQPSYTVRAVISGNAGPQSAAVTGASDANPPTSVSLVSTGTVGQLKLSWGNPAGSRTGYQVQADDGGWKNVADNSSPSYYTWSGSSGTRSMRVRTESAGGPSAYVTKSATPLWDSTPPNLPTVTSFKPESSYGRLVYRYTVSDSTTAQIRWRHRVNGGSWVYKNYANTGTGNKSWVVGTFSSGQKIEAQVRVKDSVGNESAWGALANYTLKPNLIEFVATDSAHWQNGRFNIVSSNAGKPIQGYYSDPNLKYNGVWVYGANTIYNGLKASGSHCGTHVDVTAKKIAIFRQPSGGVSQARNVYLGVHGFTYVPPSSETHLEPVTQQQFVGTIGWTENNPGDFDIPNSVWNQVMSGVFQGFGVRDDSSANYMIFDARASNYYSGKVAVWCLG